MHVVGAEMREVRLPLRRPFMAAHGAESDRGVILVRIETTQAIGWGECSALSRPTYSEEWLHGAWDVIEQLLLPGLGSIGVPDIVGNPMARTAVEMALLDAELKASGESLASHLGATQDEVPVGAVIGLMPAEEDLVAELERIVDAGYRRIKLKIQPGSARAVLSRARQVAGESMSLFLDANGAFGAADMGELCSLEELSPALLEQPFGRDEISLHAELASRTSTPVCLDESLRSVADTREALGRKACSIVCIKAPRLGGYQLARETHDVAVGFDAACWVGGMLDTSLARAANLALAALPGCTLAGDLSAPEHLLAADIAAAVELRDGMLAVPGTPGIGVRLDHEVIDRFTVRSSRLSF